MTAPGQIILEAFPGSLCPVSPIGVSALYLPKTLYIEDSIDFSDLEVFCKETGQLLKYELLDAVTLDGNSRWRESEGTHQVLVRVKAECLPSQIVDLTTGAGAGSSTSSDNLVIDIIAPINTLTSRSNDPVGTIAFSSDTRQIVVFKDGGYDTWTEDEG